MKAVQETHVSPGGEKGSVGLGVYVRDDEGEIWKAQRERDPSKPAVPERVPPIREVRQAEWLRKQEPVERFHRAA